MTLEIDGLYVQFGYRKWRNEYHNKIFTDCWYNVIKVLDDERMLLFGYSMWDNFYNKIYKNKHHDFYKMLEIDEEVSYDITELIPKLKNRVWDIFPETVRPVYRCNLMYLETPLVEKRKLYIANVSFSGINDNFSILTDVKNKSIYCWWSMCLTEYVDCELTRENTFKYVYIPFDLSSKENWYDEYSRWKEKYESIEQH